MISTSSIMKDELEESIEDIVRILKGLANEKRFRILILLLNGQKSFNFLLKEVELQKTALSNHIKHLQQAKLIDKPEYNRYEITPDGREYLRAFNNTWNNSYLFQRKKLQKAQSKGMSEIFLDNFLNR